MRLCLLEMGECEKLAAGQQLQGPVVLQKTLTKCSLKVECSVVVAEEYIAQIDPFFVFGVAEVLLNVKKGQNSSFPVILELSHI